MYPSVDLQEQNKQPPRNLGCVSTSPLRPQRLNEPLQLQHHPPVARLLHQPLQPLQILHLHQLLPSLAHHPALHPHLAPLLCRQARALPHKYPCQLRIARAEHGVEVRLPRDGAPARLGQLFQLTPVPRRDERAQPDPREGLLRQVEVGLDLEGALRVAGADEGVQGGVEREADVRGVEVAGQGVLHAEQGLRVGEGALVEERGGVFGIGEGLGGEFELVEFLRGGGLGEGGGEEEEMAAV